MEVQQLLHLVEQEHTLTLGRLQVERLLQLLDYAQALTLVRSVLLQVVL